MQRRTSARTTRAGTSTAGPAPAAHRRIAPVTLAAVLTAAALAAGGLAAPAATATGATVESLFPSDALTVPDAAQLTGRRISIPTTGCTTVTVCGLAAGLNQLDGFDLDPRIALRFSGPVSVAAVIAATTVRPVSDSADDAAALTLERVVYDSATHTVYAHPNHQLRPGTTYRLKVGRDDDGERGRGLGVMQTRFTTESATDGLIDLRKQLDDGSAYTAAGIPAAARGLRIEASVPVAGSAFEYNADLGSKGGISPVAVPSGVQGTVVFGSYLAPSWLRADGTIAQLPTGRGGPAAVGSQRLPFVLVVPPGTPPAGGWPTSVFGHGFTRSDADVLIAASTNSAAGIATIATDVVGHGFGPRSTWTINHNGTVTTVPAYARGVDQDGNGSITDFEGSATSPAGPAAAVGSRDSLRQTAVDNMTLIRAVGLGVPLSSSALRPTAVSYFGQSFGGIYGTMLTGADPKVYRSVLNVAGGPVSEIVRLSPSFRLLTTQALQFAGLLNSTSADKAFFDESLPLRGQPPVLSPVPGALAIQSYLAGSTWLNRSGSPETFAPLVRKPDALFQVAFGDQTVPNPTAYTLLDAGGLFGRASLYRNDRTPQRGINPHGFLIDGLNFPDALRQGQLQEATFLLAGATIDPDGAENVWEVPISNPAVLKPLNFTSTAFPKG